MIVECSKAEQCRDKHCGHYLPHEVISIVGFAKKKCTESIPCLGSTKPIKCIPVRG